MGSVWVAHNEQLDVPVAVKFMAPAFVGSAELVARFEREAKAAAQLRHPNVVQIFEHGLHDGLPYMAMELLEGESLAARLRGGARLTLAETSRILGEVCLALRRAHERGLVHRDLKPANIFLCRHDDLEVVKVLDFGIAKSLSSLGPDEATKSGAILGSPHYMSPEQARRSSRQVDHRADLWALGVITFRCLVGRLPFPGDDVIDVLLRVCTEDAPRASAIAPDLGPEVDRFLARALARDPDARCQSARDFADALAALVIDPGRGSVVGPPAAPRPSVEEVADATRTLPWRHPGAQGGAAMSPRAPVAVAGVVAAPANVPAAQANGAPIVWGASPPSPLRPSEPPQAGTLTSAAADMASFQVAPRPRSWVVPFAVVAALVVIGVVAGAVVAGGGSAEEVAQGPREAAPASSSVTGTPSSPEPVPSVSPVSPAPPEPGPSASVAVPPAPSTEVVAAPSTGASAARVPGQPVTSARPRPASPAPTKTGTSVYLAPAQF